MEQLHQAAAQQPAMAGRVARKSIKAELPYGKRVMLQLVDERARQHHARPFASIPISNDVEDGYRDISYFQFANAVNRCASYLTNDLGPSTTFEPIIYIGPSDLRYHILALATPKAGYSVCYTSPKNTIEAQLALTDDARARFIASPARPHRLVSQIVKQRRLRHIIIPELDVLLDETLVTGVPFGFAHDFMYHMPWVLLQTADETGKAKLRMLRHGFASSIDAWSLFSYNDADHKYGQKRVFCSVPMTQITGLVQSLVSNIWLDSTAILPPALPLTADLVNRIHVRSQASASVLSASILSDLAGAPEYKPNLLQMHSITYTGGVLPKTVGDLLASQVALSASIASPEIGAIPTLPTPPTEWDYVRVNGELGGIQFRRLSGADEMFELVLVNTNRAAQVHPVFSTFPGIQEYPTRYLFTPHPSAADMWRYTGRTDNVIMLGSGDEFNPTLMEDTITASSQVNACMVVGHGRPRPSLLVQLESHSDNEGYDRLLQRVWPAVDKANKSYPKACQIVSDLILFTYQDIPLSRDEHGQIRRLDAYQIYRPDINTLYNDWHDHLFRDVLDLDFDTNSSATLSLLFLLRRKFGQPNIEAGENFLQRGLDSIDVLTMVKLVNAGYPPITLEVKDIYDYPTARSLAQYLSHDTKSRAPSMGPISAKAAKTTGYSEVKGAYTMDELFADDSEKPLPLPPRQSLLSKVAHFLKKGDNFADAPPDGGLTAWLQILGCFCIAMNNMGLASAYGVYQAYYLDPAVGPLRTLSESKVSWIGTTQAALTLIIGVLSGPIFDAGYFFSTLITASIAMIFSFMMLSLADKYYQIVLIQGILQGLCAGLLYIPSIAQIPQYFSTKKGLAIGIATAGAPFGGILYPIVFRELLFKHGFKIATRGLGGVAAAFLIIAWIVIKPLKLKHQIVKKKRDPTMFKDKAYLSFLAGGFFMFAGLLNPFILSATYFYEVVQQDKNFAFYCVAIINAGNVFGRIIPAALADRLVYPEYMMIGTNVMLIVLGFVWMAVKDKVGYVVFLLFFGFFSGPVASLPASLLPHITPSMDVFATRLGLIYAMAGVGVLIGTPVSTAIDGTKRGTSLPYIGSQVWVGVTMTLALPVITFTSYHGLKRVKALKAQKMGVELKERKTADPAEDPFIKARV